MNAFVNCIAFDINRILTGGGAALTIFGDHQKTKELEDEIIPILIFDGISMQIVLLDTYKITYLVKWVCFHCRIVLFHGHWTFFLKLELDSLVITVIQKLI